MPITWPSRSSSERSAIELALRASESARAAERRHRSVCAAVVPCPNFRRLWRQRDRDNRLSIHRYWHVISSMAVKPLAALYGLLACTPDVVWGEMTSCRPRKIARKSTRGRNIEITGVLPL
jgi:hypothetical protein